MRRRDTLPGRWLRTAAHLRPEQVTARLGLRARRVATARLPGLSARAYQRPAGAVPGWPTGFVPFDGRVAATGNDPDQLTKGCLTLLGTTRQLRDHNGAGHGAFDWEQAGAPLLWRYHLHYWDWAWCLTRLPDGARARAEFATLYRSWRENQNVGTGVAWSPYVASLRAWSLCGLFDPLVRGGPDEALVGADLATHAAFLRHNLERDVGGNHLLKNLKALVGLAVASGEPADLRRGAEQFRREVNRQVLPDGGHFERAPAYHCQVLADVDDVVRLLSAAAVTHAVAPAVVPASTVSELSAARDRMRRWLREVLGPDRSVPILNDGYPVVPSAVEALLGETYEPGHGSVLLGDTGLAVLRAGPWHLLADVGLPCPDDLPAHAHADTLGFLLWHDGEPLLVDVGTSTYDAGQTRDWERSTAAHSTVMVDGADSTEVWGAFRAGRRARPHVAAFSVEPGRVELAASHDGYRHLPGQPVHHRRWEVDEDRVRLVDRVTGSGRHRVEVTFHWAPGLRAAVREPTGTYEGTTSEVTTPQGVLRLAGHSSVPGRGHWKSWRTPRAIGWQQTVPGDTTVFLVDCELPTEITVDLAFQPHPDQS